MRMRELQLRPTTLPMELGLLSSPKKRILDSSVAHPPVSLRGLLTRHEGPSSNIAFIRQIVRTTTATLRPAVSAASPVSPGNAPLQSHMLHVSRPPSPAPSRFNLSENISIGTEPFVLPQERETLPLIQIFFNTTGVLFPYIDKDGFLQAYHQLNSTNIRTVRRSWLGLLNMVLAMSTSTSHGSTLTASERAVKSNIFFRRASALREKQIRHGTSLETGGYSLWA